MNSIMQCDGHVFEVTVEPDDMDPPWENGDGHGPVEYRSFRGSSHCPTAPGEVVLHIGDRGDGWVYDLQAAQKIALRDGWGISDEMRREQLLLGHHLTRRRIAATAVQEDMDYLRGYLRGDWCYVWINVTMLKPDGSPSERSASLGGLEYGLPDSDEYINECAHELAREILHEVTDPVTVP